MKNIYAELLETLKDGKPASLNTNISAEGQAEKWIKILPGEVKADFREYYYPEERLIILGGGHVSWPLALFAEEAGFSVTVVDDRPAFANRERFPGAREVLCESFEKCFDKLQVTAYDYVVVVTRGHRYDMECLKALLSGKIPAYVGMMGSKRRVLGVKELLEKEGFDKEKIESIHMPIGLSIGALTPGEIAISIMAELIQVKRQLPVEKEFPVSDTDFRVLEKLAVEEEPHGVVTILSTKGSVPRRSGAKMIVYQDGRIFGSIGGGCAEAEVMRETLACIGTGKCKVKKIDMTKDMDEEDVMVCGGIMEVFIEG
ncbi:MAG: xanthine dehydrogenase [Clostridia bacterium]|nr:XdhC family protein [Lachnospiraceae bacterium]NCB99842.1 xanthine dehydrogenase [Clostridia bacterium]NCD02781.1 xanthine dehydrogenase [Clostridia bacterium]